VLIGPVRGQASRRWRNALIGGGSGWRPTPVRTVDGKGPPITNRATASCSRLPSRRRPGSTLPGLRGIGLWDAARRNRNSRSRDNRVPCRGNAGSADCRHGRRTRGAGVLAGGSKFGRNCRSARLASYRKLLRENEWMASRIGRQDSRQKQRGPSMEDDHQGDRASCTKTGKYRR